jgi:hypothetical protein
VEQLLYIAFGWCLGLLGPAIVDRIRRHYQAAELMRGITVELHELQYTMAVVTFTLRDHLALVTDDWLAWAEPILRNYTGEAANPKFVEGVTKLKQYPEAERNLTLRLTHDPTRGLALKEYTVPFLTAHMGEISIFPLAFQSAVLRLKGQLDIFNQQVVFLGKQYDRTFASLSQQDHRSVISNIERGYKELADRAKLIADAISRIPYPKHKTPAKQSTPARGSA